VSWAAPPTQLTCLPRKMTTTLVALLPSLSAKTRGSTLPGVRCRRQEILCRDIGVKFYPPSGFLLLLPTSALCDKVQVGNAGLTINRAKLQLLPWTHLAGPEATKLSFKILLFIEGIPHHAHRVATIQRLLPQDTLIEGLHNCYCNNNKASCCIVMLWARNLNTITKEERCVSKRSTINPRCHCTLLI
jgi:hypothetical protein